MIQELQTLLAQDDRFLAEGRLLRNRIIEAALRLDKHLIKLLLTNSLVKRHFFTEAAGVLIFDREKFMKFINNKEFLPDSYTAFKNKIGLMTDDGRYMARSQEVVLAWPYKDCVLEGGQEDADDKRYEVFHNEVLGQDEIDRLLDPKVFINFKRFDADGEHELDELDPKDNLIIKGNNLLVLHSLKKRFARKVKLIYIDPPYNTNSDSFQYNDSFRESTWLTFMKNRLEVARELLREDGSIIVQISDKMVSKLRILMDEIFGTSNFINKISVRTRSPSGFKTVNLGVFESAEYLLLYGRNKQLCKYKTQYEETSYDPNYCFVILNRDDPPEKWTYERIDKVIAEEMSFSSVQKAKRKLGKHVFNEKMADYALKNARSVFRFTEINDDAGAVTRQAKELSLSNPNRVFVVERENYDDRIILNGKEVTFYSKKVKMIDGEYRPTKILTNIWTDIAWEGIAKEGGVTLNRGKKPERLLRRLIDMVTEPGDIVLDFFMGTGTTCAVAHKMRRQYIGIEQLDYGKNSAVVRLQNVINGDPTGVSRFVEWKGGGAFVYCELKELNEKFVQRITDAEDTHELLEIWNEMKDHAFLSYRIDPQDINDHIEEFSNLSFDEQKRFLIETLDKNHLYVNYSEIEDEHYDVESRDIDLNRKFYEEV